MALTLISTPVTVDTYVNNIFAGFLPVEYIFKREDLQISGVSSGLDNKTEILTGIDLSTYLEIGDSVYLYAVGDNGYIYDEAAEIVDISTSYVTIDVDFIESASSGYINYFKNYYVEIRLVNADNQDIKVLPFSLKDDGDNAGNVIIDVSIANDKNKQIFAEASQELLESRIKFSIEYRQVYQGSSESFVLIDEPIILVYATEQMEVEQFINNFDNPKIYKGYDSGVIFAHSDSNNGGFSSVKVFYDELNLNKENITIDTQLSSFDAAEIGFLFTKIPNDISLDSNTRFLKIKGEFGFLPDYESSDYNNNDYNV